MEWLRKKNAKLQYKKKKLDYFVRNVIFFYSKAGWYSFMNTKRIAVESGNSKEKQQELKCLLTAKTDGANI